MAQITSRDNQKLKLARRVRDGREKTLIFLEGVRLAEEAIRSPAAIREVFFAADFVRHERSARILDALKERGTPLTEVADQLFDSIADTKNSQGVVLLAARPATDRAGFQQRLETNEKRRLPVVLLLHRINNPSNLGAILRTAEAVDAAGVIATRYSADVFSPKALRSALGASLRLPVWDDADFHTALDWARGRGLITTAADVNAEKAYTEIDWRAPRLVVFGSEAHGLADDERAALDEALLVPMENGVESLNLAVSCGVILFEAKRQFGQTRSSETTGGPKRSVQ